MGASTFVGAILLNSGQVASKSSLNLLELSSSTPVRTKFSLLSSHFINNKMSLTLQVFCFYSPCHKCSVVFVLFCSSPFSFPPPLFVLSRYIFFLVIFLRRRVYSCSVTPLTVCHALYHVTLLKKSLIYLLHLFVFFFFFQFFLPVSSFSFLFYFFLPFFFFLIFSSFFILLTQTIYTMYNSTSLRCNYLGLLGRLSLYNLSRPPFTNPCISFPVKSCSCTTPPSVTNFISYVPSQCILNFPGCYKYLLS
jgi:hypothetical protein